VPILVFKLALKLRLVFVLKLKANSDTWLFMPQNNE
jgi:hypothetical protein